MNETLTPSQKAKRRYAERHRIPDEEYLKELRQNVNENEWVTINGHENYVINRFGVVYFKGDVSGKLRRKSRFITKTLLKIGYYRVVLDRKQYFLHRLLAECFIPNPNGYNEIDHIDGNPQNNDLSNLRWCTHKENLNNVVTLQREKESHMGKISNIQGRKKVWIDKSKNIYKMV